jgi:Tol biopolymer transport system component
MSRIDLAGTSRRFGGDVAWSPDGTKITFILATLRGPGTFQEGIATANADGSDVHLVTNSPTFDNQTDWGARP